MAFKPIHKHLVIKAKVTLPITSESQGNTFMVSLIEKIGMVQVTPARSVYVSEEGNEGLTGSVNLATSHIAYHIWDKENLLMMDVYSCRDFDIDIVFEHIYDYMGSLIAEAIIIDRETGEIENRTVRIK
jgi:S-adenosylmethionine/arginine decarboxylase-like enzyme